MPFLRITADQKRDLDIGQGFQQAGPPGRGTAFHRGTVTTLCVIAGKAEPHGDDGNAGLVIEFILRDPHPVAQAFARRIVERLARDVGEIAGRLPCNKNSRRLRHLQNGIGRAIHLGLAQAA